MDRVNVSGMRFFFRTGIVRLNKGQLSIEEKLMGWMDRIKGRRRHKRLGARIWSNKQATGRNNDHWAVHHLWVCRGISTFLVVTLHQDKANVMY